MIFSALRDFDHMHLRCFDGIVSENVSIYEIPSKDNISLETFYRETYKAVYSKLECTILLMKSSTSRFLFVLWADRYT